MIGGDAAVDDHVPEPGNGVDDHLGAATGDRVRGEQHPGGDRVDHPLDHDGHPHRRRRRCRRPRGRRPRARLASESQHRRTASISASGASDVQQRLVLAREAGVRQILRRRAGPHRDRTRPEPLVGRRISSPQVRSEPAGRQPARVVGGGRDAEPLRHPLPGPDHPGQAGRLTADQPDAIIVQVGESDDADRGSPRVLRQVGRGEVHWCAPIGTVRQNADQASRHTASDVTPARTAVNTDSGATEYAGLGWPKRPGVRDCLSCSVLRQVRREAWSAFVCRRPGEVRNACYPDACYPDACYPRLPAPPPRSRGGRVRPLDVVLDCAGLTKRFGRTVAVEDLSLSVRAGEVFGFLGPNGAGKSTTIRLLLGLIRPSAGTASVFSIDAREVRRAHRHVAYVPADVVLWPFLTGAEILELLARIGPGTDLEYRAELVRRFELDLDRPARTYSTGNRQKVALVSALSTVAPLLVLDEPTSGLDPLMEREFRRCVAEARDRGRTVFLSSHQLGEVEALCDRVGILRAGRLVEVARIEELRRLRRAEVEVSWEGTAPVLSGVPGVSGVERLGPSRLRFFLSGSPTQALRALAAAGVTALQVREPTLEEIFLEYFGEADGGPSRGPARAGRAP